MVTVLVATGMVCVTAIYCVERLRPRPTPIQPVQWLMPENNITVVEEEEPQHEDDPKLPTPLPPVDYVSPKARIQGVVPQAAAAAES